MRTIAAVFVISVFFILFFPICLLLLLLRKFNRRLASRISQWIVRGAFKASMWPGGMKYTVLGKENVPTDTPVLYAANHRGILDAALGYIAVPNLTGFVAKKEIRKVPFLNLWMYNVTCLFFLILFCDDSCLMVEVVQCVGQFENICTDLMWCKFVICVFHHFVIFCKFKHQCFLAFINLTADLKSVKASAFRLEFI